VTTFETIISHTLIMFLLSLCYLWFRVNTYIYFYTLGCLISYTKNDCPNNIPLNFNTIFNFDGGFYQKVTPNHLKEDVSLKKKIVERLSSLNTCWNEI